MSLTEQDLLRLFDAIRAITSTLCLPDLLKEVMRLAGEVVGAEASSLLLVDANTGELYFDVALGEKGGALQQVRLKKGEGIAGWVGENLQPAIVNDVSQDPRWAQRADEKTTFQTKALLAVPMLVRGRLIGVMEVINRRDGAPFGEPDVKILEAFAAQAGVAIENARLFESIRQEKEKMSTILGEMTEGALLLEGGGQILLANAAATKLLGRSALEGNSWQAMGELFEMKPSWEDVRRTLGGAGGIELRRKTPPTLILAGVINQLCDDRGQISGYLIVLRDVTEERREAQLKKNFLGLVSHKLKTPLVAIRGFTPLLLEKPDELSSFQKTAIETIDRNSQLLASLVEKLVWFSALESDHLELHPTSQQLATVVDSALVEMAGFLKMHQADVERDASLDELPVVAVDKLWLKEALRNLIENAVKFNNKEGRRVKISGKTLDGRSVELSVSDNGPGIPYEEHAKLFQKFYQIEGTFTGQVPGMGLGLAMVKRVVESHGGQVGVESVLGQGSTFTLTLPIN
jgi:signal transduction histidine kinase